MNQIADKLALVSITLWVGALWAIGYLAAPTLFYHLPDRQLAGALAGGMFSIVAYIGMACGTYLLLNRVTKFGAHAFKQGFFLGGVHDVTAHIGGSLWHCTDYCPVKSGCDTFRCYAQCVCWSICNMARGGKYCLCHSKRIGISVSVESDSLNLSRFQIGFILG